MKDTQQAYKQTNKNINMKMKTFLSLIAMPLFVTQAAAEVNDTTLIVNNRKIVIAMDSAETKVSVYDTLDNKLTKSYESTFVDGQQIERIYVGPPFVPKKGRRKFTHTLPTFFIGMDGLTEDVADNGHGNIKARNNRSWEFGCTPIVFCGGITKDGHVGITGGLQMTIAYNHMQNGYIMKANNVEQLDGYATRKSYMKYASLRLPLFLDYRGGKKNMFYTGLGMSVEWRNNLTHKYKYNIDDGFMTVRDKQRVNHWGLNLEYHIGYGCLQMYARSALTPLYKLNDGTKAYPFAVGLGIRF